MKKIMNKEWETIKTNLFAHMKLKGINRSEFQRRLIENGMSVTSSQNLVYRKLSPRRIQPHNITLNTLCLCAKVLDISLAELVWS